MSEVVYHERGKDVRGAAEGYGTAWHTAVVAARNACLSDPEREACGYMEDRQIIQCVNVSKKGGRFRFSDDEAWHVFELLDNERLEGMWHSHPLGHKEPSDRDWIGHPHGVPLYIVALLGMTEAEVIRFDDGDRPVRPGSERTADGLPLT